MPLLKLFSHLLLNPSLRYVISGILFRLTKIFKPIYNGLPEEKEPQTIPSSVICYYDVILALDLDCADFNENPVIGDFSTELVDAIFDQFEDQVLGGAVRALWR